MAFALYYGLLLLFYLCYYCRLLFLTGVWEVGSDFLPIVTLYQKRVLPFQCYCFLCILPSNNWGSVLETLVW